MLDVFDSHIPRKRYGGDGYISYDLSDVDNEMDDKDRRNGTDSDLVRNEDGVNAVLHNSRYRGTKSFKEVQELVKIYLSGENIDNNETQIKKKDDEHPPPTMDEEAQEIPALKPLFNDSEPTKGFKKLNTCSAVMNYLSWPENLLMHVCSSK